MTKFLVGLEKFPHSLTHSFCRYIVKALTFPYLFLKRQKVLHLFCQHPTQEPLLHRKQRFFVLSLAGRTSGLSIGSPPHSGTGRAQFRGFTASRAYPVVASAALPGRAFLAPEPLCCSSGSADKRSAGLPAEGDGDAEFPLLHRKQRFLFYRLPGEPAAF